jgi:RNA polymerase subunit RPABC4/transcription elongation factor Spt4
VCDRCDEIILKETEVCQCGSTEFIDDISEALLREYDFLKQFCLI